MKKLIALFVFSFTISAKAQTLYFPPPTGTTWDTLSPASLGWCQDKIDTLIDYLGQHHTKAFIILKDGKIVVEHYFGTFTTDSIWYWASAGKSLTSFLVGLAQEQGYLNIHDSLPKYLGHGFSSCGATAEDSIHIIHQLTMTTGFDDMYGGVTSENHCTDDSCLVCIAPPGTRWAYHNAPYTMTHWVLDSATNMSVNAFKNTNLLATCGITGLFVPNGYDDTYYSKARSFARFGLLTLARGIWDTDTIMHDTTYFNAMVNTSQNINLAYGYLWWLNGKSSYHFPNYQIQIPGYLSPHAPVDMFSALGKNDQILNVVPSMNLVTIRMGDAFGLTLEVGNVVNDSIWIRLNDVFCNATPVVGISNDEKQFLLYPNPTSTSLSVSGIDNSKEFKVEICNSVGQILFQSINTTSIDISSLATGLYFCKLEQGTKIAWKKFIRQ